MGSDARVCDGGVHRVLSKALRNAVTNEVVNVTKAQPALKVDDEEMVIVRDVSGLVAKLPSTRPYVPAMVALFTGIRLGEVLALRHDRIDLDRNLAQV
jgi:integrase